MKVNTEDLRRRYEILPDNDLIDLYLNETKKTKIRGLIIPYEINIQPKSELTEIARVVLHEVLVARGITEDRIKNYITEQQEQNLVKSDIILSGTIVHYELSDSHGSLTMIAKLLRTHDPNSHPFLEMLRVLFDNFIRGIDKFHMEHEYHFPQKQDIRADTTNIQPRLIAFIFRDHKDINLRRSSVFYRSQELYDRISPGDKIYVDGSGQHTGEFSVLIDRRGKKRLISISSGSVS